MPLVQTRGAASAQGFGEFAQAAPAANYIEDVFSTYLYTGNTPSTNTIVNGIDLATKGGMVWTKTRSTVNSNTVWDTARGVKNLLITNQTAANLNIPVVYPSFPDYGLQSFNTTGFTLGKDWEGENQNGVTECSWTFRKQAKFFDIVTYTGDGANRTIAHNLGSTPGFVIVKRTDTTGAWLCNPVALTGWTDYLVLNTTAARATDSTVWNSTSPTSTTFSVGTNADVNANGGTYVAYLFANNAGGFGLTGSDNVIRTLLVSSAASGNTTVNLGFEPQFLLLKKTAATGDWFIYDIMRGMAYATGAATLLSNSSGAETTGIVVSPTATGFTAALDNSFTYFCLAIRRGPMKTPTSGTSVFSPVTYTGNDGTQVLTTGFAVDAEIVNNRDPGGQGWQPAFLDRLRGNGWYLASSGTAVEGDYSTGVPTEFQSNTAVNRTSSYLNYSGGGGPLWTFVTWALRRAPGFFDVVCYTSGNSTNTRVTHNLGVAPELIIVKTRSAPPTATTAWGVYVSSEGRSKYMLLYKTDASTSFTDAWGTSNPTTTDFGINDSATGFFYFTATAVAYLFATVAGVSKVGSYTGNGSNLTIPCGFTAGARFVMIKRTDSTGDWYVWDSARGINPGNDPHLSLNTNAAEVTTDDSVDADNSGFIVNQLSATNINVNTATYIFLAIA